MKGTIKTSVPEIQPFSCPEKPFSIARENQSPPLLTKGSSRTHQVTSRSPTSQIEGQEAIPKLCFGLLLVLGLSCCL